MSMYGLSVIIMVTLGSRQSNESCFHPQKTAQNQLRIGKRNEQKYNFAVIQAQTGAANSVE